MRYRKGTIEINPAQDESILTWVLRCGFVSTAQLWRFLALDGHRLPRRSFNWRLQRLTEHRLIRKCSVPTLARESVYAIDALGVAHMMGRGEYCAGAKDRFENANDNTAILHALDLNEIRLALHDWGLLSRWTSDTEIRAQNEFTTFGYAKDYDAVVGIQLDGRETVFALEYERTPKAGRRYAEIRKAIESETRITLFLYLTVNFHVLNFVAQFFENTRKPVYFGLVDEFRVLRLDAKLLDATRRNAYSLRNLVAAASHETKVRQTALPA